MIGEEEQEDKIRFTLARGVKRKGQPESRGRLLILIFLAIFVLAVNVRQVGGTFRYPEFTDCR